MFKLPLEHLDFFTHGNFMEPQKREGEEREKLENQIKTEGGK